MSMAQQACANVVATGGNYHVINTYFRDGYDGGSYTRALYYGGTDGIYSASAVALVDGDYCPATTGSIDSGLDYCHGWRALTSYRYPPEQIPYGLTWRIDATVQLTGRLCGDNQCYLPPWGDCYTYGNAKTIASGLANSTAETRGTFTAEEGNTYVTVDATYLKVILPIEFGNDEATLNGDDLIHDWGMQPNCPSSMGISLAGKTTVQAKSNDAAEEASLNAYTRLQRWELIESCP